MRTRALVMAILLALTGMAGCIGGDDDLDDDVQQASVEEEPVANETNDTVEEELGPEVETTWHNGSVQGGSLLISSYCYPCENTYTFELEEGADAIVVELAWEDEAAIHLQVYPPDEYCEQDVAGLFYLSCPDGGQDDSGESPARVEITDEDALELHGEWRVQMWPQDTYDSSVEVVSVASVLSEGELPPAFTKIEET